MSSDKNRPENFFQVVALFSSNSSIVSGTSIREQIAVVCVSVEQITTVCYFNNNRSTG